MDSSIVHCAAERSLYFAVAVALAFAFSNQPQTNGCPIFGAVSSRLRWECKNSPGQLGSCCCLFSSNIPQKRHPERSNSRTLRVTQSKDLRLPLPLSLPTHLHPTPKSWIVTP